MEGDLESRLLGGAVRFLSTRDNSQGIVYGEHYVLYDKLSSTAAKKIMERKQPVSLLYKDESLLAVELPSKLHGAVTSAILLPFTRPPGIEMLLETSSNCVITIDCNMHQSDGTVTPVVRQPNFLHPTIVVEVACTKSLDSVFRSATNYLQPTTTLQAFIAVKIWDRNGTGKRAMLYMYFDRRLPRRNGLEMPSVVISFGDAELHTDACEYLAATGMPTTTIQGVYSGSLDPPCNTLGIPIYCVHFPTPLVFRGSTSTPNFVETFDLDLYFIQSVAHRHP